MTVLSTRTDDVAAPSDVVFRLLVTRRDAETPRYDPLGFLTQDRSGIYRFAYLRSAVDSADFRPLPGLSRREPQESPRLFPIFAERVMSSRRPDRRATLEALGLGLDAAPFEVLQRSGGRRVGDTIELVPAPWADPEGRLSVDFLVHGVRYRTSDEQERISSLSPGDKLRVVPEPSNVADRRALLITDDDDVQLGYVPGPLLHLLGQMSNRRAAVVRANGPEVGFHLRLLANVAGAVAPGMQPFAEPRWETV